MSDIATELRRALQSATPGPWFTNDDDFVGGYAIGIKSGPASENRHYDDIADLIGKADATLIVLLRNNINALLDERERLLAVAEAARKLDAAWVAATDAMDDDNLVPTEEWSAWMRAHTKLRAALDAPEGK